jgi:CheY-like chemotaxis protein
VAKILVADDNSNIQKMVVLALKDQGIEVVAVGNGEAAVRKISDLKPDLVLADIFMPVRNGYEVCKFVKDNSALSHIPVILLVGAFDPLDEQEAQRVGADGVLKKPFVPPDPLISMVKAALSKAGVSLGAASAPPPPPPMPVAAKSEPAPPPRVVAPVPVLAPPVEEEIFAPAASSKPAPFTIEKGSQPLAFGSLLESAGVDEEAVFAVSPSTANAPERDFASSAAAEEEEEPEEAVETGSWRVSSLPDTVDETPAGQTDWREAAFSGVGTVPSTQKTHTSGWAPSIEKNSLSITEEEAATQERERESSSPASTNTRGQEDWGKAIREVLPEIAPEAQAPPAAAMRELPAIPPAPISLPEIETPAAALEGQPDTGAWKAGAGNAWESETQSTSKLASSWDNAIASPAATIEEPAPSDTVAVGTGNTIEEPAPEQAVRPSYAAESLLEEAQPAAPVSAEQALEHEASTLPNLETLLTSETQELLQEETANAVASQVPAADDLDVAASAPAALTPLNMDEIVAKVLAKMNPDVLQAVTREILKPLVEAMIKNELDKK